MNENGFRRFLKRIMVKEADLSQNIEIVREVETFLRNTGEKIDVSQLRIEELRNVIQYLFENGKNSWNNLLALLRYSRFTGNREIEIALLELLDGSDVLNNLSSKVKKIVGEKRHREIFEGIEFPSLGTFSIDKPKITKKVMERLEAKLGEVGCRQVLLSGPHATSKKAYVQERKAFAKSKGIDDFLRKRHNEYIDELERHLEQKTLYFTQEIDEQVLDYVRNTPSCQNGIREGSVLYVTKIPYMAKRYLNEKDPKMKRYYYCHCPWVREAIRLGIEISPNFCYCSVGFEKRPWDVIFNQSVKADLMETVLKGDLICRFAIHIPEKYLKSNKSDGNREGDAGN